MNRRTFLRLGIGGAAGLALEACTKSSRSTVRSAEEDGTGQLGAVPRPTLRIPGGAFGFPSPFGYMAGPGYQRMILVYDSLLWPDTRGHLLPWLASTWERDPDGRTYRFQLREGVRWHDGRSLTAEDVAFTFQYFAAKNEKIAPFVIVRPQGVSEVRASGERDLEIRLEKPIVTFERTLAARLPIIPKHIWTGIDDPSRAQDPAVLVGSGPYRLASQRSGDFLYESHDDFFLGRPFVKRIEMRQVGDELTALLAGELDAGGPRPTGASPTALAPFRNNRSFGLVEGAPDFTVALYWNLGKGGPLGDVRFRRACAMTIDRQDILRRLVAGRGRAGNPGFLPPGHPFHVEVESYDFNRSAANRLLDEAGYRRTGGGQRTGTDGRPLRFKLMALPEVAPVVDIVRGQLEAVGIGVEVDPVDFVGLVAGMGAGAYEMAMPMYGNLSADPDFMRSVYSSTAPRLFLSAQGYVNPELDQLAEAQREVPGHDERKRLVAQMQRIVARDLPLLPLYYPTNVHLFRKAVFDQWAYTPGAGFLGSPYNKQVFVTGTKAGGLEIRPTRQDS